MNRYTVVGSAAECEPGSNGLVLRNRLGITDPGVMGSLEQDLLLQLYEGMFINGAEPHRVTVLEVIDWHRLWLESVYPWAGQVRRFNLSKGNFAFSECPSPARSSGGLSTRTAEQTNTF
jgi:cell filamentation protein